jgi:hypothetical protein
VINGVEFEKETHLSWKCKHNEGLGKKPVTRANV